MKKKLRKIVVQDRTFWWFADWYFERPDWIRVLRVRIWGGDKMSRKLSVDLISKTVEYPVASAYPKPKDISLIIAYALAHGWDPSARGGPYRLHEAKDGRDTLELEDLRLAGVAPHHQIIGAETPALKPGEEAPFLSSF